MKISEKVEAKKEGFERVFKKNVKEEVKQFRKTAFLARHNAEPKMIDKRKHQHSQSAIDNGKPQIAANHSSSDFVEFTDRTDATNAVYDAHEHHKSRKSVQKAHKRGSDAGTETGDSLYDRHRKERSKRPSSTANAMADIDSHDGGH